MNFVIEKMFRITIILLLFHPSLFGQEQTYVVQLIDRMLYTRAPIARVTISDNDTNLIAQGRTDSTGCFAFKTSSENILVEVDSAIETCDGGSLNKRAKIDLTQVADTIEITLSHYWVDRWPNALFFDEGTLLFTSFPDSLERCDFQLPDSTCSGFESLGVLLYEYNLCEHHFTKVEIRTWFTANEGKQYGNSLALKRAEACIDYLKSNGMNEVEFLVEPIPYKTRPLKNPDGSIRAEEINVIMFRVLEW